ncbi:head-to-tail adaptor [Ruegeria phage RpAliso]|nr:head-to-tail adaptor [Ruegeria phage RpAliso]
MPFTFVVEDGTGLSDATSYVSVDEADSIIAMNIHAAPEWAALDVSQKEALLAWASRYLDERARWFGARAVETSALRWPRAGIRDRDNRDIASDEIPMQLKIATAEMARYLMSEDRTVERDQDGLARLKADVIELEFLEGYRLPEVPDHMQYLILGLGSISAGHGPKFKRIIR